MKRSFDRYGSAVEEHALDEDVVVEILEVSHGRERAGEHQGLRAVVGGVGVDEELGLFPDRLTRAANARKVARGIAADLHLDEAETLARPVAELVLQLRDRINREAAAAVDRRRS